MTLGMNDEFEGRCLFKLPMQFVPWVLIFFQTCFPWHFIRA